MPKIDHAIVPKHIDLKANVLKDNRGVAVFQGRTTWLTLSCASDLTGYR
jgi:hypothetical protein